MLSGSGSGAPDSHGKTLLTRRHFLYGAIGVGVIAATAGGAIAVTNAVKAQQTEEAVAVLKVPAAAVSSSVDFTEIEDIGGSVNLVGSFEFPYGTLVWTNNDTVAACLLPTGETAKPLTQVSLLHMPSGENRLVLDEAIGQSEGFDIYDVRASERGLVWTEANILDGIWRIYIASHDGSTLGDPQLVDEGDSQWDTPTIAAVGSYAFWQVLPSLSGEMTKEPSLLKRARFASGVAAETVYTSIGRMCSAPYPLADSLVITPRADTPTVNYQLTLIDAESGDTKDRVVMPTTMKPLEAGYGKYGFTFSFDAWYNFGDGISTIGTYTPSETHDTEDYDNLSWFTFARTPTAAPAWCGDWFIVKSTRAVCGVDLASKTYYALPVESGCDDYGDYLATTGQTTTFVTFTNIDEKTIDGTARKLCLVRVWAPV